MSSFKVFVKSIEDNTFIGRIVPLEAIGPVAERENFNMGFTETIEFLKAKGIGDFLFYDSYKELIEDESNKNSTYVIGELPC